MSNCSRQYFVTTFECINRYKAKRLFSFFIVQPPGSERGLIDYDIQDNTECELCVEQLSVQYGCDNQNFWQKYSRKSSSSHNSEKSPNKVRTLSFHSEEFSVLFKNLSNFDQILLKTYRKSAMRVRYIFCLILFLTNCLCVSAKGKNDFRGKDDNGTYTEGKFLKNVDSNLI